MTELFQSVPLLAPRVAPLAYAVGVGIIGVLWLTRTRHLAWRAQLALVAGAASVGVLAWLIVDVAWHPVADGVGRYVWAWVGVIALVVLQAVSGRRRPRPSAGRRLAKAGGALAAIAGIVVAALLAVNAHFGAYPTLAAALGLGVQTTTLDSVATAEPAASRPAGPLVDSWTPPVGMPEAGQMVTAEIPSSDPGFTPRTAYIYLPPAYLADHRPLLPVLVLMAGQPGEPKDWLTAGQAQKTLDTYAQAHNGLAPVVVIPDVLGASTANPLCSDAYQGNVATYVQSDVPAWIGQHLQVDPDHARWAVAGLSNGGTCALQVVTRDPALFPIFLALSAEAHPTLGSEEATIAQAFGGDRAAYESNDPLSLMAEKTYPGVTGLFSVGSDDAQYGPAMTQLVAGAKASGMKVDTRTYPGGHGWNVWSVALADQIGWLGDRLGITA